MNGKTVEGVPIHVGGRRYTGAVLRGEVVDRFVQYDQYRVAGLVLVVVDKDGLLHYISATGPKTKLLTGGRT